MKFVIKETGAEKDLVYLDVNGCELTQDILYQSGAVGDYVNYDFAREAYVIEQADYDWWADYIANAERDAAELGVLLDTYGPEVWWIVNVEIGGGVDYTDHHAAYQRAFKRIRAEMEESKCKAI